MRRRSDSDEQASLFTEPAVSATPRRARRTDERWKMPETSGATVAEVRVRWMKRLTPAQVQRVERELAGLPVRLSRLGFGPVEVERSFVRRRRG